MKLFGRGRDDRPEVRLRRAVEGAGQPTTHRITPLLESFGHESATPEALSEVEASLESVGLITNPPLAEVDGEDMVEIMVKETTVPDTPAAPVAPGARQDPEPDEPLQEPADAADQLRQQQDQHDAEMSALRDELQTQLAIAREEAAGEQRAREEAEARATEAKEELEAKTAELAEAERRIDAAYGQRLSEILEAQESAGKEREETAREIREMRAERDRLDAEAREEAVRRDAELAEAHERADEAFALLEAVRAEGNNERERRAAIERRLNSLIAGGKPEPTDDPGMAPPEGRPAAPTAPESADEPQPHGEPNGSAGDHRVPAFHQPPAKSTSRLSMPKIRRGRKRNKGKNARYSCAVTGAEAPSDSQWELRRNGWIVSGDNALSPEAQADGWQYPEGAALPFRKLAER